MTKVLDISEFDPHVTHEVICIACYKRWYAVHPVQTTLADLQCPQCNCKGFVICTGQAMGIE